MKQNKFFSAIKNPKNILLFILNRIGRFIKSDALYYKLQYYCYTGKWLNIDNPKTYVEKMQWLKVYDRNPLYTTMADKYAAKKYVADVLGEKYIVPLLGVWNRPEEINYESLPNKFVLKATHGGGALDVVICKDKTTLDKEKVNRKLTKSLNSDFWRMREYQYKDIPRRIIAEQYLEDESGGLNDYKVMAFNGQVKLIQVHRNRFTHQTQDFFDTNWNKIHLWQRGYPCTNDDIDRPSVLEEMIKCSEILSKGLPQIRVDWYVVNGKLYFGELTLTDGGGFSDWNTEEWDQKVASWIDLSLVKKSIS